MIVYKTTNLKNGLIYVGQDRYNRPYYLGSGLKIKRAIKKYGVTNFSKEILCICTSKEEMDEKEKHWIKELESTNPLVGYNIVDGGQGGNLGDYANKKKSETLKKYFARNPKANSGKNNPRYDHFVYSFFNYKSGELFEGTKNELAIKVCSNSSAINALVNKSRFQHKCWILYEFKDLYTEEYFHTKRSEISKQTIKNTIIKHGWKKRK